MRIALAALIALHGVIHLLGPAKAFRWADVSQLRAPISPEAGLLWLLASALLIVAAIGLLLGAPWWWYPALSGVLLSQGLIVSAWSDAKFGTLANVIIAISLLVAALDARPSSFRSRFEHDRDVLLARPTRAAPLVTEADLGAPAAPDADVPAPDGRRRTASRAELAGEVQRADAQQRGIHVDAVLR